MPQQPEFMAHVVLWVILVTKQSEKKGLEFDFNSRGGFPEPTARPQMVDAGIILSRSMGK